MTRRVFLIYGWGGYLGYGWFPWLKGELESRGFEVHIPELPNADAPRIEPWVRALSKAVGIPDGQTYFVGHSMGCQAIVRYIETLGEGQHVGGAVFVAGFFKRLTDLGDDPESKATQEHWLKSPPDLLRVKDVLPKSIAIFSDNDPYVPLDNQDDFREKLGSEIIIEHYKGHFSESLDGTKELPIAFEALITLSK